MSELRLFSIEAGKTTESRPTFYKLEREVQTLFEANLETLLGVKFVASEFSTGQGRIDTLGIDENGFPVVIEYKLDKNRTVINQGMSYMAWLRSHKEAFWKVVFEKLGKEVADRIDHSSTRLICIATEFSRDDLGAYELMPNNIDLVRYRRFGEGHLILERVTSESSSASNATSVPADPKWPVSRSPRVNRSNRHEQTLEAMLTKLSPDGELLLNQLRRTLKDQGDDVVEKEVKHAIIYKRTKNFASVVLRKDHFILYLNLNPSSVELLEGMRDVSNIGHWGTGDLEIKVRSIHDLNKALPFISQAYEGQA